MKNFIIQGQMYLQMQVPQSSATIYFYNYPENQLVYISREGLADDTEGEVALKVDVEEEGALEDDIMCVGFRNDTPLGRCVLNKEMVAGING